MQKALWTRGGVGGAGGGEHRSEIVFPRLTAAE